MCVTNVVCSCLESSRHDEPSWSGAPATHRCLLRLLVCVLLQVRRKALALSQALVLEAMGTGVKTRDKTAAQGVGVGGGFIRG